MDQVSLATALADFLTNLTSVVPAVLATATDVITFMITNPLTLFMMGLILVKFVKSLVWK